MMLVRRIEVAGRAGRSVFGQLASHRFVTRHAESRRACAPRWNCIEIMSTPAFAQFPEGIESRLACCLVAVGNPQ
jgi:hypothetical protein